MVNRISNGTKDFEENFIIVGDLFYLDINEVQVKKNGTVEETEQEANCIKTPNKDKVEQNGIVNGKN